MASASKLMPRKDHPAGAHGTCGRIEASTESAQGETAGRLPNRAWAGRGSGAVCDLCHLTIDQDQIEYEVELSEARPRVLTLHLDCYERWVLSGESLEV